MSGPLSLWGKMRADLLEHSITPSRTEAARQRARRLVSESGGVAFILSEAHRRSRAVGEERAALVQRIIELRKAGDSYRDIAQELRYSASQVCRIINRYAPHLA